ncbi:DJ-1 family glyoxalase III [Streptococcus marmotae]|uniref:DJ-1 family glyoxalase III n=1 Tax=Streptococcus marmotae TaxID=1825069 RepID=UPI00083702C3|nr:DJ-1 family glyoxalase III [Streptococcus marmotae]
MKKVAVVLANGFEEIEALTPVDVLRRASIECDMVGLTDLEVEGSHGIKVQADKVFSGEFSDYDMVVLPGGMPGSVHLRDHDGLVAALQVAAASGKWIAAICAAPIVLERAGLLTDRRYTCYPGKEAEIPSGQHVAETVVVDEKIITSRGAGTSLAFAYQLVDVLGGDGDSLAQAMVYER